MVLGSPSILLTGATGFVGRQILRALEEKECRVRAVIRSGKETSITRRAGLVSIVASADIFSESISWWTDVCDGIDTVIHAAWYVQPDCYLQSPKNWECLSGTLRLAEGAVKAKVRRFAGIGTLFEYDTA